MLPHHGCPLLARKRQRKETPVLGIGYEVRAHALALPMGAEDEPLQWMRIITGVAALGGSTQHTKMYEDIVGVPLVVVVVAIVVDLLIRGGFRVKVWLDEAKPTADVIILSILTA